MDKIILNKRRDSSVKIYWNRKENDIWKNSNTQKADIIMETEKNIKIILNDGIEKGSFI